MAGVSRGVSTNLAPTAVNVREDLYSAVMKAERKCVLVSTYIYTLELHTGICINNVKM